MKNAWKSLALGALVTGMTACSGGGGGTDAAPSTDRSVTIKGSFNTGGLASLKPIYGLEIVPMAAIDYGVYCMAISGSGKSTSYGGPLSAAGAFNFVGAFPPGKPIGCLLTKSEEIVGFFSFKTSTNTKNETSHQKSYPLKEDSSELDFGTGLAVTAGSSAVEVATVTDNGTIESSNTITDLTGAWNVVSTYVDHDNGYYHPCDMEGDDQTAEQLAACKASWGSIYLNMYKFTKSAEERFGISLWENQTAFTGCGSAEGYNGALNGWSPVTGFNANGPTVSTAFPTPSLAMNTLTTGGAVLTGAPFRYYGRVKDTYFETNCPIMPDMYDGEEDVPAACKNAAYTSCGSFSEADWKTGLPVDASLMKRVSARKVQCVMNSLTSGGETGYNWGSSCAFRLKSDIWDSMYGSPSCTGNNCGWGDTNMEDTNGTGCKLATCADAGSSIAGLASYWNTSPRLRHIQGEVFLAGAVASGTSSEIRNENVSSKVCPVVATFSYTFTKTGANTMDAVIENIYTRGADWGGAGKGTEAECVGTTDNPTWLGQEFKRGVVKIKLGFQR